VAAPQRDNALPSARRLGVLGLVLAGCMDATPAPAVPAPMVDPRETRCRAASNKDGSDCFLAANDFDRGAAGHPVDRPRAVELYALGCKVGPEEPSCGALKNEIVSLQLVVATRGQALALLEAACNGGNLDLCNDLATAYRDGVGTAPEPVKALALFARTCAAAPDGHATPASLEVSMVGCRAVVALLGSGAVPADEPRAAQADARMKDLKRRLE